MITLDSPGLYPLISSLSQARIRKVKTSLGRRSNSSTFHENCCDAPLTGVSSGTDPVSAPSVKALRSSHCISARVTPKSSVTSYCSYTHQDLKHRRCPDDSVMTTTAD